MKAFLHTSDLGKKGSTKKYRKALIKMQYIDMRKRFFDVYRGSDGGISNKWMLAVSITT
jgi:hypothetical protein